jgi:hypothetical protein
MRALAMGRKVSIASGTKTGKALALDTPIPTPSGWATMGALKVGDIVFDENGRQCRITYVSPVFSDRECYRITFIDGATVVADVSHEWVTSTDKGRNKKTGVRPIGKFTTEQIAQSVKNRGVNNHAIDVCGAIECPRMRLPLSPYLLGVWLGDGGTNTGYLYIADRDIDILSHIGPKVEKMAQEQGCSRYKVEGLRTVLNDMGVLRNKHVPENYLRSSAEDRLALLQGLLDTDGTCDKRGRIEFNNSLECLADAVYDLAAGLGLRPTKKVRTSKLKGREVGIDYRVAFVSPFRVFRTKFKQDRQKLDLDADTGRRSIVSVERVDSVPVRCITVDSPSSLFLCTKSYIPTHNTKLIVWLALWFYCTYPYARVFFTSTTNDQIDNTIWKEVKNTVRAAYLKTGFQIEPVGHKASSGIQSADGREIKGFTVANLIALQGLSGAAMLFIADEFAGMSEEMFATIMGNLSGGGFFIGTGNPNHNFGPHFDSHHHRKGEFATFVFNAEEIAKGLYARGVRVPGVCTLDGVGELERAYTRDGEQFYIRVLGQWYLKEEGVIFSRALVMGATDRVVSDNGRTCIGIDPAGHGDGGDETAICVIRGQKVLALQTYRGMTERQIVERAQELTRIYRQGNDTPYWMIDSEGPIGSEVYKIAWGKSENLLYSDPSRAFKPFGIKASFPARRDPTNYEKLRDELYANLAVWLQTGSIPADHYLQGELQFPQFQSKYPGLNNKLKATPKDVLRERLGRSPDRLDALMLAAWDPEERVYRSPAPVEHKPVSLDVFRRGQDDIPDPYGEVGIDPYAGR